MNSETPIISGWGHTPFKKHAMTLEDLIVSVSHAAIQNAGVEAKDIDEVVLGNFNSGMDPLGFPSSLVLQTDDELWGVPCTRVENACSSGAAAIQVGIKSLLAGTAQTVLVVGAEKMTAAAPEKIGAALLGADYDSAGQHSTVGFTGLFAEVAQAYAQRISDPSGSMARIAAKNHANGMCNPLAHLHKNFTAEFCAKVSSENPIVAAPLRRTDCSPVSDGAAAIVLTTSKRRSSSASTDGADIIGWGQASDFMPKSRRDPLAFRGSALAWQKAMTMAELQLDHLSAIELHDCFTIAELVLYDVLGLVPAGSTAAEALRIGRYDKDGPLPINVSGGLKSKGHPVGATGVSQAVMAAMQLTGQAGDMQLPNASHMAIHNMGGLAISNYVHVLAARS